jgi:hypothetical protein
MKYKELDKLLQAFSDSYEETIYHYTSAEGLLGIIDNHELWMSNAEFMNDTTELRMLKNSEHMLQDTDFNNKSVKEAWEYIFEPHLFSDDVNTYYIISFSKEKDMLEQWRGYGNYCIGFDAEKLKARRYFYLYSCIYTEKTIRNWILKNEKIDEWKEVIEDKEKRLAAHDLINIAQMKYKNDNFRNEKEVRLITQSHHKWIYENSPSMYEHEPPIHFRYHPIYGLIPYVRFYIKQNTTINERSSTKEKEQEMKRRKLKEENSETKELLPIKEVIIGPIAHQQEAKAACEILLEERGYKDVKVDVSKIPYRGF